MPELVVCKVVAILIVLFPTVAGVPRHFIFGKQRAAGVWQDHLSKSLESTPEENSHKSFIAATSSQIKSDCTTMDLPPATAADEGMEIKAIFNKPTPP